MPDRADAAWQQGRRRARGRRCGRAGEASVDQKGAATIEPQGGQGGVVRLGVATTSAVQLGHDTGALARYPAASHRNVYTDVLLTHTQSCPKRGRCRRKPKPRGPLCEPGGAAVHQRHQDHLEAQPCWQRSELERVAQGPKAVCGGQYEDEEAHSERQQQRLVFGQRLVEGLTHVVDRKGRKRDEHRGGVRDRVDDAGRKVGVGVVHQRVEARRCSSPLRAGNGANKEAEMNGRLQAHRPQCVRRKRRGVRPLR
mmetsp:Transcript_17045/g.52827  ORF Transcript_17045/g.52827 Transcript_17045/m.52827 type:complete len:254 (+) Transcript_17045:315-1076(+)